MALLHTVKGVMVSGFSKWDRFVGGQCEQNGQKLHDFTKSVFWEKQWGTWGASQFFFFFWGGVVGDSSPVPPH